MVLGWLAQYSDTLIPLLQAKQSACQALQQFLGFNGGPETIHQNKLFQNRFTGKISLYFILNYASTSRILPAQACVLQLSDCWLDPIHVFPLLLGAGLLQFLFLVLVPPPQKTLQVP